MFHVTSDRATICARCPGIVSFTELKHFAACCFFKTLRVAAGRSRNVCPRARADATAIYLSPWARWIPHFYFLAGRETTSGGRRRGSCRGSGAHGYSSVVSAGGQRFVAKVRSRLRTPMRNRVKVSVPAHRPSKSPRCFPSITCLHMTDTNPSLN